MKEKNLYASAHLIVAAIRVAEHLKGETPTVETISKILSISSEVGHLLCNKLDEIGIIEMVKGTFGTRLFIRDHLKIEEIPKDEKEKSLEEEVSRFVSSRKEIETKVEQFQAEQSEKQRALFSQLEKRLKEGLEKGKK